MVGGLLINPVEFRVPIFSNRCWIYIVEAQNEAQRRVQQHGIHCPSAVRNVNGEEFTLETLSKGVNCPGTNHFLQYIDDLLQDSSNPSGFFHWGRYPAISKTSFCFQWAYS